jgi:hypothetical protein
LVPLSRSSCSRQIARSSSAVSSPSSSSRPAGPQSAEQRADEVGLGDPPLDLEAGGPGELAQALEAQHIEDRVKRPAIDATGGPADRSDLPSCTPIM